MLLAIKLDAQNALEALQARAQQTEAQLFARLGKAAGASVSLKAHCVTALEGRRQAAPVRFSRCRSCEPQL